MTAALIAAISTVVVVLLNSLFQIIGPRAEREMMVRDVEILEKLPGDSSEAREHLQWVILDRAKSWRRRTSTQQRLQYTAFRYFSGGVLVSTAGVLTASAAGVPLLSPVRVAELALLLILIGVGAMVLALATTLQMVGDQITRWRLKKYKAKSREVKQPDD